MFFEVPEIAPMEMTLLSERRNRFADEMLRCVRTVIPVAVALLYVSRAAMFWVQYSARPDVFDVVWGFAHDEGRSDFRGARDVSGVGAGSPLRHDGAVLVLITRTASRALGCSRLPCPQRACFIF